MRKLIFAAALLVSVAALAQEKQNSFYVFVSDPQYVWTESNGSDFNAGFGVAVQHMFTPRWSGEVSASHRSSRATAYFYDFNGNIIQTLRYRAKMTPVDLMAQYHFTNNTAWKPYLGAGYSHVFVDSNTQQRDANYFVVNGGVVWRIRPAVGLRFDGKVLFGDRPAYIDSSNLSIGVAWRF